MTTFTQLIKSEGVRKTKIEMAEDIVSLPFTGSIC